MKNSEAVKLVEDSLGTSGLGVLRVGSATPAEFKQGDHPDISAGKYRVVDVTVVIPDNG